VKFSQDVIIRPVISEKSYRLMENNKFTFEVDSRAKKVEIRRAIEDIFKVTVTRVNTVAARGKNRRQGWSRGRTSDWKKAIVTLKEGDRIEFFEAK